MARGEQLLLAVRDTSIGSKIGIPSLSHVVGNHVTVKCLEEIADHYENIGLTVGDALKKGLEPDHEYLKAVAKYNEHLYRTTSGILDIILSGNYKA